MILIELAVETLASAKAAAEGGAHRIELCADLAVAGLTPSADLTRSVLEAVNVPVFAMVRLRPGDFVYSAREVADMCRTMERLRGLGVHGLVTGAITHTAEVDTAATRDLVSAAGGLPLTFHRAFDLVGDQTAGLEQLASLGVTRVLTSGDAPTALGGSARLRALVGQSRGRVVILAGGGVRESNVQEIVLRTGVVEVHSRLIDREGEELTAARVRSFCSLVAGLPERS